MATFDLLMGARLYESAGINKRGSSATVIAKAKTTCEISGHAVFDHFVEVNKTIQMPKNAEKEVPDILLTRYACYLIAQNGDSKKPEIAFAQSCLAKPLRR
jgi:DNA-damage-inducible protein D